MMKGTYLTIGLILLCSACPLLAAAGEAIAARPIHAEQLFDKCDAKKGEVSAETESHCAAWDHHLAFLERQLESVCVDAGDKVIERIKHVGGIYVDKTVPRRLSEFYKHGKIVDSYVAPGGGRAYRFVEYGLGDKGVSRLDLVSISEGKYGPRAETRISTIPEPTAEFEVVVDSLLDPKSRTQGLYGDRIRILDRVSGRLLASRTIYYLELSGRRNSISGQWLPDLGKQKRGTPRTIPCQNLVGTPVWGSPEQRKSAYWFVSSVLVPMGYTSEERRAAYDLSIGGGSKTRKCTYSIRLGPGISLDNLTLSIGKVRGLSARLGIRGHEDELHCASYYLDRGRLRPDINFADGTTANLDDLLVEADLAPPRPR